MTDRSSAKFRHDYLLATRGGEPDPRYRTGGNFGSWAQGDVVRSGNFTDEFIYEDEHGENYLRVLKFPDKRFAQQHWDGNTWQWGKPDGPPVPYNLPLLQASADEELVFITEGEKDADTVGAMGLVATTAPEGAGKWSANLGRWLLRFKSIVILKDNDPAGEDDSLIKARQLAGPGRTIRIVAFPEAGPNGDVSDWVSGCGGTKEKLLERVAATTAFTSGDVPPLMDVAPFEFPDPATIPRREWLYRPHYIASYLSLTLAPGGMGKSALVLGEALAMATGRALLGVKPARPLRVMYWNLEDPLDELTRRAVAAQKHFKLSQDDIQHRLFLLSGRTLPLVLATDGFRGVTMDDKLIGSIVATMQELRAEVLIVDPFVAAHRLPENDNTKIDQVARVFAMIAEVTKASIMLVHHTRKLGPDRGTVDDGRGASALLAAVRSARILTNMSKQEADGAGIEERERRFFFRTDHGKANLTPPAEHADWFRMVSVSLGNESRDMDNGDEVGVVTSWSYPHPKPVEYSDEVLRRALAAIEAGGPWRENQRSKTGWVGYPIAEALGLTPLDGPGRRRVARLVSQWLEWGVLIRVRGKDAKGNNRPFVKAGTAPTDAPENQAIGSKRPPPAATSTSDNGLGETE